MHNSARLRFVLRGSLAFAAASLASCGPYLEAQVHERHGFTSPSKCAQGPFEFHATTIGSTWGESIELRSVGVSGLVGHAQVFVDGKLVVDSAVGSQYEWDPVTSSNKPRDPHDPRCSLSQADRATATTATSASTATTTATTTGATTTTEPTIATTTAATAQLLEVPVDGQTPLGTLLVDWGVAVESWTAKAFVPKPGLDVKVLFWTENLVDLEGVKLVLTQSVRVPSCGDDKWTAKLDADKAEADKKSEADKAEAEKKEAIRKAEYDRCYALASKSAVDGKCRDEGWHDISESLRCQELARTDAVDDKCRKDGYENASVVAERARCQFLAGRDEIDDKCRSAGFHNHSEIEASSTPTTIGPPPAPKVEEQPPKPSDHADWIPGSWEWTGREWSWVAGGWKVPDADRVAKATPKAPAPPPPQQAEATASAPPVAGLVWIAGYWHYAAARWVWIPGRWARPPQAGATWRPHTWVRDGAGVRLDPGQWILRK